MIIKILGTGCAKCSNLEKQVRKLVDKHKISAEVIKIEDIQEIISYGIMMTPGVVIDDTVVSVGIVPNDEQILKMINGAMK